MKRLGFVCFILLIMLAPLRAFGDTAGFSDDIPPAVLALDRDLNGEKEYLDCIVIEGTPGGDFCWLLSPYWFSGYRQENGTWQVYAQAFQQFGADGSCFRRHAAGSASGVQGEAGLRYADALGFDIVVGDSDQPDMFQYHWNGEQFVLIGWHNSRSGQFAFSQAGKWTFFDARSGQRIGQANIPSLCQYGFVTSLSDLPYDFSEAQAMEIITLAAAESIFPGWTLLSYKESIMGRSAAASYYRVDGNRLTLRRATLSSDVRGVQTQTDTMPVPLSEALLQRLQTEPPDALIDGSGYGNTLIANDALDTSALGISNTVLQNDLQSRGLLLLTKDENGSQFLQWITQSAQGRYSIQTSQALPEGAYLDLFHAGDGDLGLEWNGQYMQCGAEVGADGTWRLTWIMGEENYSVAYCGVRHEVGGGSVMAVGTHPWHDLFAMDIGTLPSARPVSALDRGGWAVVSNPDPADRLHLRAEPDRASASLGKFYNHTPVHVLSQKGDWSRVCIGLDGRLEGWMLTKYLTFGEAMDDVNSASPVKFLLEAHEGCLLFAGTDGKETTGVAYGNGCWIAGVVGDEWYILLDEAGNTGFLPQSWMWDGNG